MKMKHGKWRGVLLSVLGCLMLTGCGDAPYELTEEEQQLIVSYSAHVVSKFNRYQKDGLTYVPNLEERLLEEEENEDSEQPSDTEQDESTGQTDASGEQTDRAFVEMEAFEKAFADMGLKFTYLSSEIMTSYMENAGYAVNADPGKALLILHMEVESTAEEAVVLDNMASGDVYSAKCVLESGEIYNAESVMTLLLNDFTTFEGTIEPQTAVEQVIVFEIPEETEAVEEVRLQVRRSSK